MKIRLLMLSSLIIFSHQLQAGRIYAEKASKPCNCYCSVKCGPRAMESDDAPFYDEEYGQCFCKERDYRLYKKNHCDKKNNEKFETCCDISAKKMKKVTKKKASMY